MYLIFIPITVQARQKEQGNIHTTSKDNGFHLRLIHNLNITVFKTKKTDKQQETWFKFTHHSQLIHNVTNIFKHTYINIAFRASNNVYRHLQDIIKKKLVEYMDNNLKHIINHMYDQRKRSKTIRHQE
jgi:hypothetical protein